MVLVPSSIHGFSQFGGLFTVQWRNWRRCAPGDFRTLKSHGVSAVDFAPIVTQFFVILWSHYWFKAIATPIRLLIAVPQNQIAYVPNLWLYHIIFPVVASLIFSPILNKLLSSTLQVDHYSSLFHCHQMMIIPWWSIGFPGTSHDSWCYIPLWYPVMGLHHPYDPPIIKKTRFWGAGWFSLLFVASPKHVEARSAAPDGRSGPWWGIIVGSFWRQNQPDDHLRIKNMTNWLILMNQLVNII